MAPLAPSEWHQWLPMAIAIGANGDHHWRQWRWGMPLAPFSPSPLAPMDIHCRHLLAPMAPMAPLARCPIRYDPFTRARMAIRGFSLALRPVCTGRVPADAGRRAAASRQRARQGLATWFSKRFAVAGRCTVFFLSLICLRPTLIQAQVINNKICRKWACRVKLGK